MPDSPVPDPPAPDPPVPEAPVPEAPVPEAPVPGAPMPGAPMPGAPMPGAPTPGAPVFVPVGRNATEVFGLAPAERAARFAAKAKFAVRSEPPPGVPAVLANLAFAWDPAWLGHLADEPGLAVTRAGKPVLVHCTTAAVARRVAEAMERGADLPEGLPLRVLRTEDGEALYNRALRKREKPYVLPLRPDTARAVERASYDGAYKGVTDLLTLYLWRRPAFHLTRWAALAGLSPNTVTGVSAVFCAAAAVLFWQGLFWAGLLSGLVFMVLDTVDGKLARCTGTSSKWGNILDHGLDQVHPPFWWLAWGMGLDAYGDPLSPAVLWGTIAVILAGYAAQRLVEGVFMRRFGGMHIHSWQRLDSRFRLVTARRNPNVVILLAGLLVGEPGDGLVAVAAWTVLSCLFHAVRLGQALALRARGGAVVSWLA